MDSICRYRCKVLSIFLVAHATDDIEFSATPPPILYLLYLLLDSFAYMHEEHVVIKHMRSFLSGCGHLNSIVTSENYVISVSQKYAVVYLK